MTDLKRAIEDCSSAQEATELLIETTRESLAGYWPEPDEWDSETPYSTLEQALDNARKAFQRCIAFGRAYANAMSQTHDIDKLADDEIYQKLAGLLSCDMPELQAPDMVDQTAAAAHAVVRLAFNERVTEIRLAAIAGSRNEPHGHIISDDPIADAGRALGDILALCVRYKADPFEDGEALEATREQAVAVFPLLETMPADDAASCLGIIFGVAADRLSQIRSTYTPTPAASQKH